MEGNRCSAHPLETPLILECIFKNLRVPDLKTCRQVNRVWHETATIYMRPAVIVKFDSKEDAVAEDKMKDFMKLVRSKTSTFARSPFSSNYELMYRLDYPEFWWFCGSSIKSLRLGSILDSECVFRHAIFRSCPNLEELSLFFIQMADNDADESFAWVEPIFPQNMNLKRLYFWGNLWLGDISIVELLSYFPSLEKVHLDKFICRNHSKILQALATCREHEPQSWNIKNISFSLMSWRKAESDLRFLLDDSLPLETMAMDHVEFPDRDLFGKILNANANTLRSLELSRIRTGEILDTMPVLEKVVEFKLIYCIDMSSLQFLRNMPNLKKMELQIHKFSPQNENIEEENEWVLSSCEELTISRLEEIEGSFPLFRRIPNLKKLSVTGCTNKLLAGICEHLQDLVSLELVGGEVDDCGISGLDEEDVKRINDDGNLGWFWWKPVTAARPNLSCLKSLKWFYYWNNYPYRDGNALGFCAALCGVQQLPQLQHLKVEECSLVPIWNRLCDQFQWRNP